MDFLRHFFGVVERVDFYFGLEDSCALVVVGVYCMYGDARLFLVRLNNGLVNLVAVHSLAAVFWQQRRVDVQNPAFVLVDNADGQQHEESGQNYPVDFQLGQQFLHLVGLKKLATAEHIRRNFQILSAFQNVGIGFVRYYSRHFNVVRFREIFCDVFCI